MVYDEGQMLQDLRAITAAEAAWDCSGYVRFGSSHFVETGFTHKPNEEPYHFKNGCEGQAVARAVADQIPSRFKGWMKLNASTQPNDQIAKSLNFEDIPLHFLWE